MVYGAITEDIIAKYLVHYDSMAKTEYFCRYLLVNEIRKSKVEGP
jgi:hypothetical protein